MTIFVICTEKETKEPDCYNVTTGEITYNYNIIVKYYTTKEEAEKNLEETNKELKKMSYDGPWSCTFSECWIEELRPGELVSFINEE